MAKKNFVRDSLLSAVGELRKLRKPSGTADKGASHPADLRAYVNARRNIFRSSLSSSRLGAVGKSLFDRLTTLSNYRAFYDGPQRGELFVHWYYRERNGDKLSLCEIFHLNMLQYFNVMDKVEVIHVRCAYKGGRTAAMDRAIGILQSGRASVDFKVVEPVAGWEHDTFKECVEYAVDSGKFVYYAHIKGVTHVVDPVLKGGYRNGAATRDITPLDVLYWCYVMYRYMFSDVPDGAVAIGPLYYPGRLTLHYSRKPLAPKWCLVPGGHYTGSFQAMDGLVLRKKFLEMGASRELRDSELWISDPYTVEQFLTLMFSPSEVSSACNVSGAYTLYDRGVLPQYKSDFDKLYAVPSNAVCVANGTYKWIGGTDTFNWAMCKALVDKGYSVYYYAPDMDGNGVTEKYLREIGVMPYTDGIPLLACFANQQSGKRFVGKCPVVQTCHSAYTSLEMPIKGAKCCVSVTEEIQAHLKVHGYSTPVIMNGIDLQRYCSKVPLHTESPRVLSICQGDDTLLKEACASLGWEFRSVPKKVDGRIWHIEDWINEADIVVGIGRSLYDAMACGRVCISWDNRKLNPYCGCGYITADNWYSAARTNFTGRGFAQIYTVAQLMAELKKYNAADGAVMRGFAEKELDMRKNVLKYLSMAGIPV